MRHTTPPALDPVSAGAPNRTLVEFLAAPARPDGTLDAYQLEGFLFAVTTAPEAIDTSEWIPAVFNHADPAFASEDESVQVFHGLMEYHAAAVTNAQAHQPHLSERCTGGTDAVAECAPDAPLARWSQGFLLGYEWLSELWDSHLPEELADAHEDDLACLGFFADAPAIEADIANRARRARRDPVGAFRREAEAAQADFAAALASFAARGRLIRDYVVAREAQRTPVRSSKTARNAPCPCGSGRKYKKCCGAATG